MTIDAECVAAVHAFVVAMLVEACEFAILAAPRRPILFSHLSLLRQKKSPPAKIVGFSTQLISLSPLLIVQHLQ